MSRPVRRIQSIEIGFRIIRVLEKHERAMALKDIAAAADMPASKARIYLSSFIKEGLVKQEADGGHYGLGSFAFQLGLSAIRQVDVIQLASPEIQALRDETGFSAYLCLLSSRGPVVATRVDGRFQGALSLQIGFVMPWLSATGYAFLAWMPPAMSRQYVNEENPAISAEDLERDLAVVREKRYATPPVLHVPIVAGFSVLSAPVFDHARQMAGALCMLGPASMLTEAESAPILCDAADRLTAQIGGTYPDLW